MLDERNKWTTLDPIKLESTGGATLKKLDDKSALVSGAAPERDVYVVTAKPDLKNITAVRVEAMTDASLPQRRARARPLRQLPAHRNRGRKSSPPALRADAQAEIQRSESRRIMLDAYRGTSAPTNFDPGRRARPTNRSGGSWTRLKRRPRGSASGSPRSSISL